MRERTQLDQALSAYRAVERELNDIEGLIELAEAEADKAMIADAEGSLAPLKARVDAMKT
jgi:peptide chain release factor 2